MEKIKIISVTSMILLIAAFSIYTKCDAKEDGKLKDKKIFLPEPKTKGSVSVEETLSKRRSVRKFQDTPLSIPEVSQLLWAAYGITEKDGRKTTPSAGATYPLEIYVVVKNVEKLKPGLYKYDSGGHFLTNIKEGNFYNEISETTYQPQMCKSAPMIFVITAITEKTTSVYGERGIRYIFMETGHSAQNISLQGVSLGIGSVLVGAFDDDKVAGVLSLKNGEIPLYIIPVGKTERYK